MDVVGIGEFDGSAQGIDKDRFSEFFGEVVLVLKKEGFKLRDRLEGTAIREGAAGLDGDLLAAHFFGVTPATGWIEIFQAEADGVHFDVAGGAGCPLLVEKDHVAIGHGFVGGFIELGNVGRWRSGLVMQDFFEDEGTTNDG